MGRKKAPHPQRFTGLPQACRLCSCVRLAAIIAVILLTPAGLCAQPTPRETAPADDLPQELRLLYAPEHGPTDTWTLLARNEQADEQEPTHPELNVPTALWHLPLAANCNAFRFEFNRPLRTGGNVLHLYIKADRNDETGRIHDGSHRGVDYMLTLIDGNPQDPNSRLDVFTPDGRAYRGPCTMVVRDKVLYAAGGMTLEQADGESLFDILLTSYVKDANAKTSLGYLQVRSTAAPTHSDTRLLINPNMVLVNGQIPGWRLSGKGAETSTIREDPTDKALLLEQLYPNGALLQTVTLLPGHYLLRALVRTDTFAAHLCALSYRIPIGVQDDYRWVALPFVVSAAAPQRRQQVDLGIWHIGYPPTRHHAPIRIRAMDLVRLGDTVLPERWAESLPVDPLHGLKLLQEAPAWNRPGKVVFRDSFLGTELWLLTQEGKIDHSYVGHPDFDSQGKYLQIGSRRPPRGLLRTDGSTRHLDDSWQGILWPFPWELAELPRNTPPQDWIVTSRNTEHIHLQHVVTGDSHRIDLPQRPGWQLVHLPGLFGYGGRGPRVDGIDHRMLVWLANTGKTLGLSTVKGDMFRAFPLRSISADPVQDRLSPSMSSVWGKGGNNWQDALDREGKRYFLFELNRDNRPDHPGNPYQVWALPLAAADRRGLLRVVFNPRVAVTEFAATHSGNTPQPSFNWWDLAAGLPRSGDNAVLQLEDGTLLHMSSLGMHSSFRDTIQTNCPYSGSVTFFGSFPRLDRISWPHEIRRDQDFAVVASHAEPASPLVMLDLEHSAMWTVALSNFHDYAKRYRTRWDASAYHKPMFRPAPTFSPDFTKIVFYSPMLTGDHPDRPWGDVYVAVVRYPEPPLNPRLKRSLLPWKAPRLEWDKPRRHREIKGYNLYHAGHSGQGYLKLNDTPLPDTAVELDLKGFYVLTSVEYSGLESRVFSTEVQVGDAPLFRHIYQTEAGHLNHPMLPFFEPAGAGGAYAVAVTDPELVVTNAAPEGQNGSVTLETSVPAAGPLRIMARVRGLSPMERSTYMTARTWRTDPVAGTLTLHFAGRHIGDIRVSGSEWTWVDLPPISDSRPRQHATLKLETRDAGVAVDAIALTNDPHWQPRGTGLDPETPPDTPHNLRTERFTSQDRHAIDMLANDTTPRVKLAWDPPAAPRGVAYYAVYRATIPEFTTDAANLLGSPRAPVFYDTGLEAERPVFYRVAAVDAWGNHSPASEPLRLVPLQPQLNASIRIAAQPNAGSGDVFTFTADHTGTPGQQIESWHWRFGDGSTAQGKTVRHRFAEPGSYKVELTVSSNDGEWAKTSQTLNVPPGWIRTALEQGAVWIEAETLTAEGNGQAKRLGKRINASGEVISYWQQHIGHWLEWTLAVPRGAVYTIALKYASGTPRAVRDCMVNGTYPGESWKAIEFPGTGGFSSSEDNWVWHTLQDGHGTPLRVHLEQGTHTLRMHNLEGGMALDAILLLPLSED